MTTNYLPEISKEEFENSKSEPDALFELLAQPLHQELYRKKDFTALDGMSQGQQLIISFDYVYMQVAQGGFIQLIHNGYIALLLPMPEWLYNINDADMAKLLDDVLKVYVLNKAIFDKAESVQQFAGLYNELKEFEDLDSRYFKLKDDTIKKICDYAIAHIHEFATLK